MKIVALCILCIATGLIWGYNIGSLEPKVYTEKHVMVAVCDEAHRQLTTEWMSACELAKYTSGEKYKEVSE